MVEPSPAAILEYSPVFRPYRAARYWVSWSVPDPRSVTPIDCPFHCAGEVMWVPVAHMIRSPGDPDSCATSSTALPWSWKLMVCTYQAPARSTCPDAMAVSAPTPPATSLDSTMLTPYFL